MNSAPFLRLKDWVIYWKNNFFIMEMEVNLVYNELLIKDI